MSDRICIASNGNQVVELSPDDLISCCEKCTLDKCKGGYPEKAWDYWVTDGIVTGGLYDNINECKTHTHCWCGRTSWADCNLLGNTVGITPTVQFLMLNSSIKESRGYFSKIWVFTVKLLFCLKVIGYYII